MQHYLKDGEEHRIVTFKEEDVLRYCHLFNINSKCNYVPTLMCTKLWPEFELYKKYVNKTIILKETYIKEINKLVTNEEYDAILRKISAKTIKNVVKSIYCLEINKNNKKCISIKQTFIEVKR